MNASRPPFDEFLSRFSRRIQHLLREREDPDRLGLERGMPPFVLREVLAADPLSAFIPVEHGGRGTSIEEGGAVLEAMAYESLGLGLILGISGLLFLQPFTKYGQEAVKAKVYEGFLRDRKLGGLMLTEPGHGSDALNMQTRWTLEDGVHELRGTKHWAGLTGWADYWLLSARRVYEDGSLSRDVDLFMCDLDEPGQRVIVEERYNNLGLHMIPYGRNRIEASIPAAQRLTPRTTGVKLLLDHLNRSRMQMVAMAMGFLRRMLDEATAHCRAREVGGQSLLGYDQVQARLVEMQSAVTVCTAMSVHMAENAGLEFNLAARGVEANAMKSWATDAMHESAQSLLQLCGAMGYRFDHIAGRSVVDSRPWSIAEGSNDILYDQIGNAFVRQMRIAKQRKLGAVMAGGALTARASERLGTLLDVEVDAPLAQREQVQLGRVVSRVIAMEMTLELGARGYAADLIEASVGCLTREIAGLLADYVRASPGQQVDLERASAPWREFLG